ncbi:MAG: histone deacetylase [Actinomycetia bacterium]|nr:histone deacetylase [Actinomycetes bacterium]
MAQAVLCATLAGLDHHDTGRWHPERPARLAAVQRALADNLVREVVTPLEPRQATIDQLAVAHDRLYLEAAERFVTSGGGALDPNTITSKGSWATARWAAGTGLDAVEDLTRTDTAAAFVGIRPPGHHASANHAMGFCLINNVAVVAATLAARGERVAILDWDVHHGNGTQEIFWDEPRVLYASMHEHPAYPGTGLAGDIGGEGARGMNVNVPLPEGSTGESALAAFDEIIGPAVSAFAPNWLLLSAGYDAHRADPLAGLAWSAGDYGLLSTRSAELMTKAGRVVVFLEGGYDLNALSASVTATVAALSGVGGDQTEAPTNGGPGRAAITEASAVRRRALGGEQP